MPPSRTTEEKISQSAFSRQSQKVSNFFSIPAPVKALFEVVPVLSYPANPLPSRGPKSSRIPSLYVFSTERDAAAGRPSFNPTCLKWQTFLNIAGIDHRLVASNNHASPTGILPFLLPGVQSSNSSEDSLVPVTSNKLVKYAADQGLRVNESFDVRYEAYQALLDHRIRNAWLYTLYLEPRNFSAAAHRLYVSPASSNLLVRTSISHMLRVAAEEELLKHGSVIDKEDLYNEAEKAFGALSALLGNGQWFFANQKPALFDASVFAYTQLLLDEDFGWKEQRLCIALRKWDNLVQHRERILVRYYGGTHQ